MKTTLVGSLPFLSTTQAIDYTFEWDVPTLFTLPQKDRRQFMGHDLAYLMNICEDSSKKKLVLRRDYLKCTKKIEPFYLKEFLEARDRVQNKELFKYQLIGPVTLYHMLDNKDEINFEDFSKHLFDHYTDCIQKLSAYGKMIFSLDEPLLNINKDFYKTSLYKNFLKSISAEVYIHCCSNILLADCQGFLDSLHLNHSLYNGQEGMPCFFIGLEMNDTNLPQLIVDFQKNKNKVKLISPSCGLALESIQALENYLVFFNQFKSF